MKKIICIGECALNVVFEHGMPVGSLPGGRIAAAAALMAADKCPVVMASEASADPVGDMVMAPLIKAGVDISSVDRFTEGHTPVMLFTEAADGTPQVTRYEDYADQAFDIVWPVVEKGSVVIFGGYYAIDRRMRTRMLPFLNHCAECGAALIYFPGFMSRQQPRITRIMPSILENLELAHLIVARDVDLALIFGTPAGDICYADHIDFYCRSLINIDTACRHLNYFSGKQLTQIEIPERICETMTWNAGVLAGVAAEIFNGGITPAQLDAPDDVLRRQLLAAAAASASAAAAGLTMQWQHKIR